MNEICDLTLLELTGKLQSRQIGVTEAVSACFDQIERTEPEINALLAINKTEALKQAQEMDKAGPDPSRPLWGAPVTIKDAISTRDLATTAASKILEDFTPIYDAFVIERLKEAGAIILAKANMDEFAMGSSTENSAFKITKNPWNLNHAPGGSSGGSAASVAARQCFASLGSDTGGSIRQPASFCGCVGLKPTYGRVSRFGLFAFASSLDQIGPIARTVPDAAAILNVIAGHDCRDNTSANIKTENYLEDLGPTDQSKPLAHVKIGFPEQFFSSGLSGEIRKNCLAVIHKTEELGAELVPVTLPDPDIATAVYYVLAMAEASSNLARYDGVRYGRRAPGAATLEDLYVKSRSQGFGQEVKRRIMLGSFVLSSGYYDAYFKKASQVRRIIFNDYNKALESCDAMAMPVAPMTAWPLGSHALSPLQAYLMDAYTLPVNLAGLPAIAIPAGLGAQSRLPTGLQLVGRHFGEKKLLKIAHIIESHIAPMGIPEIAQ